MSLGRSTPSNEVGKSPPTVVEPVELTTTRLSSVALNTPTKDAETVRDASEVRKELLSVLENPKAHKDEESRALFCQKLAEYTKPLDLVDPTDIVFQIASDYFGLKKFEVALIGTAGVGKSSFVKKMKSGRFLTSYEPTRGADVTSIVIPTSEGFPILFQLWDTAGVEKEGGLKDAYYIGANAALLMYDTHHKVSYVALPDKYKDLTRVCGEEIPTVVAANKVDVKNRRMFKNSKFQRQNNLQSYDISVKSGKNLIQPLLYLARVLTEIPGLRFVSETKQPDGADEAASNQPSLKSNQSPQDRGAVVVCRSQ